jgi:hypothetical protein
LGGQTVIAVILLATRLRWLFQRDAALRITAH